MRHKLAYDIVRVLYESSGNVTDIRERVLLLRINEQRAGPLRGPRFVIPGIGIGIQFFWRPPVRIIMRHLKTLEESDKVLLKNGYYSLTESGTSRYRWIMKS